MLHHLIIDICSPIRITYGNCLNVGKVLLNHISTQNQLKALKMEWALVALKVETLQ